MYKIYLFSLLLFIFGGCSKTVHSVETTQYKEPLYSNQNDKLSVIGEDEEIFQDIKIDEVIEEKSVFTQEVKQYIHKKEKLAIVFGSKIIGRYGIDAVNTVITYMMYQNLDYDIKVFDTLYEVPDKVSSTFIDLQNMGYTNVIAIFANESTVQSIPNINALTIYIPTLNKSNSLVRHKNIIYGAIDYDEQFKALLRFSNHKITEIYDTQKISDGFNLFMKNQQRSIVNKYFITRTTTNYKSLFANNAILQNSSLFLNSTVIQTAIVLSQLRVNEISPHVILSSQINYNPIILSLSQFEDRTSMLIANSIGSTNSKIKAIGNIIGSDLEYNWVNFSTIVGVNHLFFNDSNLITGYKIIDNQVYYDVSIYRPAKFSFIKVTQDGTGTLLR